MHATCTGCTWGATGDVLPKATRHATDTGHLVRTVGMPGTVRDGWVGRIPAQLRLAL